MRLLFTDQKITPLTDDWFMWLDNTFGKDRLVCRFSIFAHTDIEIIIHTPEYTMLYLYYLQMRNIRFEVIE